jgi:hypothetical protein
MCHRLPDYPDYPITRHRLPDYRLRRLRWRLSGLDIPDQVTARVARQIAERVGGMMDRPGG